MWNARRAHYAMLVASLAIILVIARNQWFFGDDWSILAPHLDSQYMQSRSGHWNLVPALVFRALRNLVGLDSYTPYLLLALAAHLSVAHLLWRILLRSGVPAWGATAASALVMLLGAGAENILWAFQFGFMGAIAVGLGLILLIDSARLVAWRIVGIVVLAVVDPMFSGTALPMLVAVAAIGWMRQGIVRTALLMMPAAGVYAVWYVEYAAKESADPGAISSLAGVGIAIVYPAVMVAAGLGRALPWVGLGVIPALAVVVWFVRTVRGRIRSVALPAYALVFAEIAFIILTSYTRSGFGLSAAAAQRYAYVTIVLLLPAMGLLVAGLVEGRRRATLAVGILLVCVIAFNAGTLEVAAEARAAREQGSEQRIDETYRKLASSPPTFAELAAPADPVWAPNLTGSDLLELVFWGQFTPRR